MAGILTTVTAVATFSLPWTSTRLATTTFVTSENAWRYHGTSLDDDGFHSRSLTSIWAYVLAVTLVATVVGVALWLTRRQRVGAVVTLAATAATTAFTLVNIRYPYFVPSSGMSGDYEALDHGPGGWIALIIAVEATVAALAGACRVLAERRRLVPVRSPNSGGAASSAPGAGVASTIVEPEPAATEPSKPAPVAPEATAERRGTAAVHDPHADQHSSEGPWMADVLEGVPGPRPGPARRIGAFRQRVGSVMASVHGLGGAVVALTAMGIASLWLSWITDRQGIGPTESLSGFQFWYASWSASFEIEALWVTLLGVFAAVTLFLAVRWILLPDPVIVTGTLVAATGTAAAAAVDLVALIVLIRAEQGNLGAEEHLEVGYGPWVALVTTLLAVGCAVRGARLARGARVWALALAPERR